MKTVVIIGGVAGGASCAARLRRLDETAEIILLERGDYISYANCGLPYHVGNVIPDRESLLVQTPESLGQKLTIDVRVRNEALSIDRANKQVTIRKTDSGETYVQPYDTLVLATGSSPLRPPIPGIDSPRIQTLRTIPDTDRIRAMAQDRRITSAAVIGGGFFGLELAENLHGLGQSVSLIEAADQVMAPLDHEMAQMLHQNLRQNGVELHLGDGVRSFQDTGDAVDIALSSGKTVQAQLVILAIGVRPNSILAKETGLTLNAKGGVVVQDTMQTEDPSIYAVGDVIEVEDFVSKDRTMVPLAGPANKQGRIAADNICGGQSRYQGTQGTAVAQVFDFTAAATGSNEKTLLRRGLQPGKDYEIVYITQQSHAGYYPNAVPMTLKVLFDRASGKLLGAQIVGRDGVDKRIDVLAAALRLGASVYALKDLELAYAPPYSSAKDPVNMVGFAADNLMAGRMTFADWSVTASDNTVFLDVREDMEVAAYALPNAIHIPLGQLRQRLDELDPAKEIVTFCAIGLRGYTASQILRQRGFPNVKVYPGGTAFYQATHAEVSAPRLTTLPSDLVPDAKVDCGGLQCPGPITQVIQGTEALQPGQVLEVALPDPGFLVEIDAWCRRNGIKLLAAGPKDSGYAAYLKKPNG